MSAVGALSCPMPTPPFPSEPTYAAVRAWVAGVDPELVEASDEVDRSLTADTLRLSLRARLDRASATARWIGDFRRASS